MDLSERAIGTAVTQDTGRVAEVSTGVAPGWKQLAGAAGAAALVGHMLIGAAYRDLDAVAVAVSFLVALGLARVRRGTVGMVVLGLAFANVGFWTVPATVTNLSGGFGFAAVAVPGTMAVVALTGLAATVGALVTRNREAVGAAAMWLLPGIAGVVLVVVLGTAALQGDAATVAQPGDHMIVSDRTEFLPTELVAEAGTVGVHLENRDYFWHTFTITELGVDLRVPIGASGRVTFEAPPGTYEFVCAIPGHDIAGMVGTLTVTGG